MRLIHGDLRCTALRVTGGGANRLEIIASYAAAAGLEVWYSPLTCDLTTDELLAFFADSDERAKRLRQQEDREMFLTGSELNLFTTGVLPGERLEERLKLMATPDRLRALLPEVPAHINALSSPSSVGSCGRALVAS